MPSQAHRGAYLRALLSAALLLAAEPCGLSIWPLAFVALWPVLSAIERGASSDRVALVIGLCLSLPRELLGHAFLPGTLARFSGLPAGAGVLAWVLLAIAQALPLVLGIVVLARLARTGAGWLRFVPCVWCAVELLTPRVFPSFLGAALYRAPELLQLAELGGAPVLSLLVTSLSVAGYCAARAMLAGQARGAVYALLVAATAASVWGLGHARRSGVRKASTHAPELRIGLVQPAITAESKRRDPAVMLRTQLALTKALGPNVDLIVWPETALGEPLARSAQSLPTPAISLQAPLVLGALTYGSTSTRHALYNSAVLSDRTGRVLGISDKAELLPFGEELPFGERWPWLYDLVPGAGRLARGATHALVSGELRVGALICYEDILPARVREVVEHTRPSLLVNLTNDAWFHGATARRSGLFATAFDAAHVHFALAVVRAVEHRLYLVRATNDGVSAAIAPDGTLERALPIGETAAEVVRVRAQPLAPTLYARWGDAPLVSALAACACLLVWRQRRQLPTGVQRRRQ